MHRKGENLSIGIRVVKKTTNSIEIGVVRAEGVSNFKYSIKKQGEEYGAAERKKRNKTCISGLNPRRNIHNKSGSNKRWRATNSRKTLTSWRNTN